MIPLKAVPKPAFLNSETVQNTINRNRELIAEGKKPNIPSHWDNDSVRDALDDRHYRGKCCYTERRRDKKLDRDVEHFRPKAEVTEAPNHTGYWWLAYDWDNLLISTKFNNTINKANHFPMLDGGQRAFKETDDIANERPALINPAIEDPSKYITFHWQNLGGRFYSKPVPTALDVEGRGKITIEKTGIDREELMDDTERAECGKTLNGLAMNAIVAMGQMNQAQDAVMTDKYKKILEGFIKGIKFEIAPERTYAGARIAFFKQYPTLENYIFD